MKKLKTLFITCTIGCSILSASAGNSDRVADTLNKNVVADRIYQIEDDDPVLLAIDNAFSDSLFSKSPLISDTLLLNKYGFSKDSIPQYDNSYYQTFLAKLDAKTPFELVYNDKVQAFINLYVVKRRQLTSKMLGLEHTYFPMFEEVLDKYNLPLEFKYLAVVESALRPTARSRSGAVGLWQFMYATGKMYDLQVNSYVDDRMDPYKATEAACKYFTYLYGLYGNWELVMAAYNCGPGNVNKAIRRSGGAKDYWSLWPYLPRETRGYVPAFIAVNYVMSNPQAHNLYPVEPLSVHYKTDTIHVTEEVDFKQISEVLKISAEELEFLNPSYKLKHIPYTGKPNALTLPVDLIGKFIQNDSLIYAYGELPEDEKKKQDEERMKLVETLVVHKVKDGEYLGKIAQRYGVGISDIKRWNNMRSSNIYIGQRLTIYTSGGTRSSTTTASAATKKAATQGAYYTIQSGDTLWDIAKAQGLSYNELLKLNSHLNHKSLKPGDKIIISGS